MKFLYIAIFVVKVLCCIMVHITYHRLTWLL